MSWPEVVAQLVDAAQVVALAWIGVVARRYQLDERARNRAAREARTATRLPAPRQTL